MKTFFLTFAFGFLVVSQKYFDPKNTWNCMNIKSGFLSNGC